MKPAGAFSQSAMPPATPGHEALLRLPPARSARCREPRWRSPKSLCATRCPSWKQKACKWPPRVGSRRSFGRRDSEGPGSQPRAVSRGRQERAEQSLDLRARGAVRHALATSAALSGCVRPWSWNATTEPPHSDFSCSASLRAAEAEHASHDGSGYQRHSDGDHQRPAGDPQDNTAASTSAAAAAFIAGSVQPGSAL